MDRSAAVIVLSLFAAAAVFEIARQAAVAVRQSGPWRERMALWWEGTAGPILLGALLTVASVLAGA